MADELLLPDVFFGAVDATPCDWRKHQTVIDGLDNDKVLKRTPKDVTKMLGFDPKELFSDEPTS